MFVVRPEGWEAQNDVPDTWSRRGYVYRGMTSAEFRATAGRRAPIKSTGAYSLSCEGTCFTPDAGEAESYANGGRDDPRRTGKPTYVVEILLSDDMTRWSDGYYKTPESVPFSQVSRIWKMYATEGPTGELTHGRLSGQVVADLVYKGSAKIRRASKVASAYLNLKN